MMPKAFFSFANRVVAGTWVKSALTLFEDHRIEPHSYKKHPETGAHLEESLLGRIREFDVFVCVLNKTYLENEITQRELEEATLLATGSARGNLKLQSSKPQVFIFWEDTFARDWLERTHPGFGYQALDDYQFVQADDGSLPKRPELWQQFLNDLHVRLDKPQSAQRPAEVPSAGSPLLVLGRPVGSFDPATDLARVQLLETLRDAEPAVLADDWAAHASRAASAEKLRGCLGSRTVTVQVCDQVVYDDNEEVPGDPFGVGKGHDGKLIKLGFEPEKSRDALARTVFWVPRSIEGVKLPDVPEAEQRGAAFCGAPVRELATWLSTYARGPEVLLKSQPGLDDIAGELKKALQKLGRIDFAAWAERSFEDSIREGLDEGSPLLVAIHDRGVPVTAERPRQLLANQAQSCDRIIGKVVASRSGPRIVRAIFLLRYPDMTKDESTVADEPWYWVPLRKELKYEPAADMLARLKRQLWPDGPTPGT